MSRKIKLVSILDEGLWICFCGRALFHSNLAHAQTKQGKKNKSDKVNFFLGCMPEVIDAFPCPTTQGPSTKAAAAEALAAAAAALAAAALDRGDIG